MNNLSKWDSDIKDNKNNNILLREVVNNFVCNLMLKKNRIGLEENNKDIKIINI